MKTIVILLLALVAVSALDANCLTANTVDPTKCYECNANWAQFNGACYAQSCINDLDTLNMADFDCKFWSIIGSSTTSYQGTLNVTNFNVLSTCYTFDLYMVNVAAGVTQSKDYTPATTKTWTAGAPGYTKFEWNLPHADVLTYQCPQSQNGVYIEYNCTFQHRLFLAGFQQTEYTFSVIIDVNQGVKNDIGLTINKLSATNTCCTVYTKVTSVLTFRDGIQGGASSNTVFAKNANWWNRVQITDVAYQVYFLQHVKATLGSTDFFYTITPDPTPDNSQPGHIDYQFHASMATNKEVTLTITNTVTVHQSGRILDNPLSTTSTGTMTVNGSNSALFTSFAAMLFVVLAIFAF